MPRRKTDDKRAAILRAAIEVIAERGLTAAPTSAISKAAGVAEGTLFTYFATKHDLANALYLDIKRQLAERLFAGEPDAANSRALMQHHWNRFVLWGVANPNHLRVLDQLTASGMISPEVAAEGSAPFVLLEQMVRAAIRAGVLRKVPFLLFAGTFEAMAQNTIRQINAGVETPGKLRRLGFEILWRGLAVHPDE
jgi:AcrR family transcriptional regulator